MFQNEKSHPISDTIQGNIIRVNHCWIDLIRLSLVLDMDLSYCDKYFITLEYIQ